MIRFTSEQPTPEDTELTEEFYGFSRDNGPRCAGDAVGSFLIANLMSTESVNVAASHLAASADFSEGARALFLKGIDRAIERQVAMAGVTHE